MSLLGYVSKHSSSVPASVNDSFVGGSLTVFPGLPPPPDELICCGSCCKRRCFLCQIYCPLSGSAYHRSLSIFICLDPDCQAKGFGWIALRTQLLITNTNMKVPTPTDWNIGDDEDDSTGDEWCETPSYDIQKVSDAEPCSLPGPFTRFFIEVYDEELSTSASVDEDSLPATVNDAVPGRLDFLTWSQSDEVERAFIEEDDNALNVAFSGGLQDHLANRSEFGCEDFRYNFNGKPIFDGSPPEELMQHLKCPRCGSKRVFEMQLFPTINNRLCLIASDEFNRDTTLPYDLPDETKLNKDWLLRITTVLVFSCESTCWNTTDEWVEECIVVQTDTNRTYIKDVHSVIACP